MATPTIIYGPDGQIIHPRPAGATWTEVYLFLEYTDVWSIGTLPQNDLIHHLYMQESTPSELSSIITHPLTLFLRSHCKFLTSIVKMNAELNINLYQSRRSWTHLAQNTFPPHNTELILRQITPYLPHNTLLSLTQLESTPHRYWQSYLASNSRANGFTSGLDSLNFTPLTYISDTLSLGQLTRSARITFERIPEAQALALVQAQSGELDKFYLSHISTAEYLSTLLGFTIPHSPYPRTFQFGPADLDTITLVFRIDSVFEFGRLLSAADLSSLNHSWWIVQ